MVNIKKIKGLMGENDHTRKFIAEYLEISTTALQKKLKGNVEFKASEIKKIADLYDKPVDDFYC